MDHEDTLIHLQRRVIAFRDERAWRPFHTPKNLAMALAIEAGELQELFLWKDDGEIAAALAEEHCRARLGEEMADILIFLFYLAEAVGLDLAQAVGAKLDKNRAKYPIEKCFGSAKKYNELE